MHVHNLDDFLGVLVNLLVTVVTIVLFLDFVLAGLVGECVLVFANHELKVLVSISGRWRI